MSTWGLLKAFPPPPACVNEQFRGFSFSGWVTQGGGWYERGCHLVQIPIQLNQLTHQTCCLWWILSAIYGLGRPKICTSVITLLIGINSTYNSTLTRCHSIQPIFGFSFKKQSRKLKLGGSLLCPWCLEDWGPDTHTGNALLFGIQSLGEKVLWKAEIRK